MSEKTSFYYRKKKVKQVACAMLVITFFIIFLFINILISETTFFLINSAIITIFMITTALIAEPIRLVRICKDYKTKKNKIILVTQIIKVILCCLTVIFMLIWVFKAIDLIKIVGYDNNTWFKSIMFGKTTIVSWFYKSTCNMCSAFFIISLIIFFSNWITNLAFAFSSNNDQKIYSSNMQFNDYKNQIEQNDAEFEKKMKEEEAKQQDLLNKEIARIESLLNEENNDKN